MTPDRNFKTYCTCAAGVVAFTRRSPQNVAMPPSRPLPIVIAVLISTVAEVGAATAQTSPEPAKASPAAVKVAPAADIAFYLARGDTDACGRGCNEWIAAEGKIDPGAPQRLRRLLAKLGRRRPPIFFHSMGGSITGSIELGRLIHDRKLEVSVAHTIPRGCDRDKPFDKSCEALKRSGQELDAEFDPAISMCNSGCVWAFAGGTIRFVPPGVKLGIHDVGLDPGKAPPRGATLAEVKRVAHARLLEYARDMGIDKTLLPAASAIPYESVKFLERDELVRFGIDRRDFGETRWHFADKPSVAMSKRFFVRTGSGDQIHYRNGLVRLDCGVRQEIRLAFAQQRDPSEQKSIDPVIDVNGQRIVLRYQIPLRGFDVRSAFLSAAMFDFVGRGADIKVSGIDPSRNDESAGSIRLNMDGFSDASVKLRTSCDQSARDAVAVTPGTGPAVASPTAPNALTDPKRVPTVTIRSDQAEPKRIEADPKHVQTLPLVQRPPPVGFGPPPDTLTRSPIR
jgi:hypothetical protein